MNSCEQQIDIPVRAVELVSRALGVRSFQMRPLPGGRNNCAYEINIDRGHYFLKAYYHHADDQRDRLGHEVAFSRYIWQQGGRCVPEPIDAEPAHFLALFEFVDGRKLASAELNEAHIDRAIEFIKLANANLLSNQAKSLPVASEACFSIADHVKAVDRRFERLEQIQAVHRIDQEAVEFIQGELSPVWVQCRSKIVDEGRRKGNFDESLAFSERCLSPSDFGYHNALQEPEGRLRFLDFEYAGWDDPAKLACDFVNQPDVTPPLPLCYRFLDALVKTLNSGEALQSRIHCLMPLYQIKWACIILNAFLPASPSRVQIGSNPELYMEMCSRQLQKARAMLDRAQNTLATHN